MHGSAATQTRPPCARATLQEEPLCGGSRCAHMVTSLLWLVRDPSPPVPTAPWALMGTRRALAGSGSVRRGGGQCLCACVCVWKGGGHRTSWPKTGPVHILKVRLRYARAQALTKARTMAGHAPRSMMSSSWLLAPGRTNCRAEQDDGEHEAGARKQWGNTLGVAGGAEQAVARYVRQGRRGDTKAARQYAKVAGGQHTARTGRWAMSSWAGGGMCVFVCAPARIYHASR